MDDPAADYETAIARLARVQAEEEADATLNPVCRAKLLTHGRKVERAIILMHGMTNCPEQFAELAPLFYAQGASRRLFDLHLIDCLKHIGEPGLSLPLSDGKSQMRFAQTQRPPTWRILAWSAEELDEEGSISAIRPFTSLRCIWFLSVDLVKSRSVGKFLG